MASAILLTFSLARELALCKLQSMTPTELSNAANISVPYASQLLSGERGASLETAIKIYDATGQQFGILKGLSADTIEELRRTAKAA